MIAARSRVARTFDTAGGDYEAKIDEGPLTRQWVEKLAVGRCQQEQVLRFAQDD